MSSDPGSSGPAGADRTGVLRAGGHAVLPAGVEAALDQAGSQLTLTTTRGAIEGSVPGLAPAGAAAWWSTRDGAWSVFAGLEGRAALVVADTEAGTVATVGVLPRAAPPAPRAATSVRFADDGHGGVLVLFDIGVARVGEDRALAWLVVHDDAEATPDAVTEERAEFTSPHGGFRVAVADGAVTLADGTPVRLVTVEGFGTVWVAGREARLFGVGHGGLRWTAPLASVPDGAFESHAVVWMSSGAALEGVRLADGGRVGGPVPCDRCRWPAPPAALDELAFDEDRATRLLECRSCGARYEVDAWNERKPPLLLTPAEARERYRGAV